MRGLLTAIAILLVIPTAAHAQNFEPAGIEANARIAVDRSVTFKRDDGWVQSLLLAVPVARDGSRIYSIIAVEYDCEGRRRRVTSREDFSARRDPVRTIISQEAPIETGPAIANQLAVACPLTSRRGSVSLIDFVAGPGSPLSRRPG